MILISQCLVSGDQRRIHFLWAMLGARKAFLRHARILFTDNQLSLVFHLAHCATECAAPKLWRSLK